MKSNKCLSPSGKLLKSREGRGAVFPQRPTRASMDSGENMHLTFDETIASSAESTAVQTPRRHRSGVNNREERLQPAGTSAARSWGGQRWSVSARSNLRGQEGRQEPRFPPAAPLGVITPQPGHPGTCSFWSTTTLNGIRKNHGGEMHRNS